MKKIGSRIYYDVVSGEVLVNTGDRIVFDDYVTPSIESDFSSFSKLSERNPESVGVLELLYVAYKEEFKLQNGYRVSVSTKTLEFSYPDLSEPEAPPVFGKPLTEQIANLELQNTELMLAVAELASVSETDKMETQLAIAELASIITGGVA
ncbi:hypothetical protein [Paenibacillus antarcticus]|uniref:Uncharacterized protein n=1 Tax=Paenibacillus antarcticus TaxID=253703 RepID=A0A168QVD5_9BACL|nr:hypothetical protein [Paenibacillus antarcticus]OAB48262.1 hypothetical protein PBAT_01070 [Paenibacillus antarcticus]